MRGGIAMAIAAAVGVALLVSVAGCSTNPAQIAPPGAAASPGIDAATATVGSEPRTITNLSQVSASPESPLLNEQSLIAGAAALHDGSAGGDNAQSSVDQ